MHRRHTASRVTRETLAGLRTAESPALVACLWSGEKLPAQLADLELMAQRFRESLRVHYALEDMFPYFREAYSVMGTPTFLLFERGRSTTVIMGVTTLEGLCREVRGFVPDPAGNGDERGAAGRRDGCVHGGEDRV